ncbi:MAG: glycosyltransferase family 2 protein, partial [Actinobacteria bacterium]|nr:glycosyltransferase family 2 protein [Actinomycetota bacterium]
MSAASLGGTMPAFSSWLAAPAPAALIVTAPFLVVVVVYTARRLLLLAACLLPRRAADSRSDSRCDSPGDFLGDAGSRELPSMLVVVPARNEGSAAARLLAGLDESEYPRDRLQIVLVDDGSADDTAERFRAWTRERPWATLVELNSGGGKSVALCAGVAEGHRSELIAVVDADHRLRPDCLRRLARALEDDSVGAAAGFLQPINAGASFVSRYGALEAWVHQLVTSSGKDRLDLNPPMLGGGCVYRRTALESLGGFDPSSPVEDVTATVGLTRAGWRTRFVREAVIENVVVSRWRHYWSQHLRWGRNALGSMPGHGFRSSAPLRRRLEGWMLSAGYLDRIAFLAVLALGAAGLLSFWWAAA